MSDGPYREGWPRTYYGAKWIEVVPLSDAERMRTERDIARADAKGTRELANKEIERMRKALEAFAVACERVANHNAGHPDEAALRELAGFARAALNREPIPTGERKRLPRLVHNWHNQ